MKGSKVHSPDFQVPFRSLERRVASKIGRSFGKTNPGPLLRRPWSFFPNMPTVGPKYHLPSERCKVIKRALARDTLLREVSSPKFLAIDLGQALAPQQGKETHRALDSQVSQVVILRRSEPHIQSKKEWRRVQMCTVSPSGKPPHLPHQSPPSSSMRFGAGSSAGGATAAFLLAGTGGGRIAPSMASAIEAVRGQSTWSDRKAIQAWCVYVFKRGVDRTAGEQKWNEPGTVMKMDTP